MERKAASAESAPPKVPQDDSYRSDLYKFTTRPVRKPPNAVVEKFKHRLKHSMDKKIIKSGDVMKWLLFRAFSSW